VCGVCVCGVCVCVCVCVWCVWCVFCVCVCVCVWCVCVCVCGVCFLCVYVCSKQPTSCCIYMTKKQGRIYFQRYFPSETVTTPIVFLYYLAALSEGSCSTERCWFLDNLTICPGLHKMFCSDRKSLSPKITKLKRDYKVVVMFQLV